MARMRINDLDVNEALDAGAMRSIIGGKDASKGDCKKHEERKKHEEAKKAKETRHDDSGHGKVACPPKHEEPKKTGDAKKGDTKPTTGGDKKSDQKRR